jgi:hypothetical protein
MKMRVDEYKALYSVPLPTVAAASASASVALGFCGLIPSIVKISPGSLLADSYVEVAIALEIVLELEIWTISLQRIRNTNRTPKEASALLHLDIERIGVLLLVSLPLCPSRTAGDRCSTRQRRLLS